MLPGSKVEFKITGDGSHTLFVPELGEHYHSVFGAIAESRHIFIDAGFKNINKSIEPVEILEIGFGTGLNALLTCIETETMRCKVKYTTIELNPLQEDIYSLLNFADLITYRDSREIFLRLHQLPWNEWTYLTKHFSLLKINSSLKDYQPAKGTFALVYFDAFGPDVQPEMWTKEVFNKIAFGLKKHGVLVTYSTKGTVKRNLSGAGFSFEKLPGPPGKREFLKAVKI
ncbi:MAG: tRNA (5-methylaminomethyl-2-thiouridine)(34)-methyltransferase MnmD [Bacteroidales bacterium]|nr:tRNA (5-methylaminomethyl-2-thiouridine)(34)-methyltransferase MnmD [Bacteroidales bacterium]